MQVALAGSQRQVEVQHPTRGDVERRRPASEHLSVEDHGDVGVTVVRLQELDDRAAAGLLLAVTGEADVDRQRTRAGELAGGA